MASRRQVGEKVGSGIAVTLLREDAVAASGESNGHGVILDEHLAWALCEEIGVRTPRREYLRRETELYQLDLSSFPGERVVVKVAAPELPHKSDSGGVVFCDRRPGAVRAAVEELRERFSHLGSVAVAVHEFVDREAGPAGELLLGLRQTDEFGPVVSFGLGGLDVEQLSLWEPLALIDSAAWRSRPSNVLAGHGLADFLTSRRRGRGEAVSARRLVDLLNRMLELGERSMPPLQELEINPLVFVDGEPVALDVLARTGAAREPARDERPIAKLKRMLEPRSMAIVGVSRRRNPGRMILENVLDQGYPSDRIFIVKPGADEVLGCRACDSLERLPAPVDLLVLAVGAAAVPEFVEQVVEGRRAEAIIAIPGGLGETAGSQEDVERLKKALARSRKSDWKGPLLNGANCLGIRSVPGRYDTLFIPRYKLPARRDRETPLALLSQSGAFAVARSSKLSSLAARYVISVGNQLDLTVGDYLSYLADDAAIRVFACYVEGFRSLDGLRFLEAAEKITASGRPVVLYRGGRTEAGQHAAVSHTAAIAGEYAIARQLLDRAGVLVAETIDEFEDLTRTLCLLEDREFSGNRLGAVSNAGFECVAVGDHLETLELAELSAPVREHLERLVTEAGLETILDVANPLDVSPIFDDRGFAEVARLVLNDPAVDVGVVGCVPLTPALQTLPAGGEHGEDVEAPAALAGRLADLWRETARAWVVVVDGGAPYSRFRQLLGDAGIPVFSTVDRAIRILDRVCSWRSTHGAFRR